ncbi:hypothetical protein J7643_18930 [bacterium]|nr:hypothetical protein [bacterium]
MGFRPLGALLWGVGIAVLLYGIAFFGLMTGRLGVDPAFGCGVVAFLVGVGSLAVFLWAMLLDCLRRPFDEGETRRLLYAALIVGLVPVGALLYYFRVVRPGARS